MADGLLNKLSIYGTSILQLDWFIAVQPPASRGTYVRACRSFDVRFDDHFSLVHDNELQRTTTMDHMG